MAVVSFVLAWLLIVEVPVAAIAVYATFYVSGVKTAPFVLAAILTALHLLFCAFCYLTRSRHGLHHVYVGTVWLVGCAGLWCGPTYYFARVASLGSGRDRRQFATWVEIGCALSALSILINAVLIAVFLAGALRQRPVVSEKSLSVTTGGSPAPQLPPLTPIQQHRISFPFPQSPTSPHDERPTVKLVPPEPESQPPHPEPKSHPPPPKPQPAPWYLAEDPSAPLNRINLILALCHLQSPQGNFPPTAALTTHLAAWTHGGAPAAAPSFSFSFSSSSSPSPSSSSSSPPGRRAHGATALARACLTDLCQTVWRAQREGREGDLLTPAELRSLERVGWDLAWVGARIELAGRWLGRN